MKSFQITLNDFKTSFHSEDPYGNNTLTYIYLKTQPHLKSSL